MLVTRIDFHTLTCGNLHDRQPYCNKQLGIVAFHQLIVDISKCLTGRLTVLYTVSDQDLGDHHKQGGRNTFAGDICHNKSDMVIVHEEEIIKVSAYLLGRRHGRIDVKLLSVRESGEQVGKLAGLNGCCHTQLRLDPLLLCSDFFDLADIMDSPCRETGELLCQHLDLIPSPVNILHAEYFFGCAEPFNVFGNCVERSDNSP